MIFLIIFEHSDELILLAEPGASNNLRQQKQQALYSASMVHVLIGPEGGFSEQELQKAAWVDKISLQTGILRIETAAVCLLSQLVL